MSDNAPLTNSEQPENNRSGYLGVTPDAGQLPPRGERIWVERPDQLQQAVGELLRANLVALDAEFIQVRVRTQGSSSVPRLAVLQLAIEGKCFVIDTLRIQSLAPLRSVLESPEIVLLLHGAGADLRVIAERGLQVLHYYDLEATCRSIFGQHESSLAAMLQRAFHSHLDKSLQRTDWTRRPLPQAMIAYAARDAEVTLALYHWLKQHYSEILSLHEYTPEQDSVAAWIEPFLRGTAQTSAEVAVAEARAQGLLQKRSQTVDDCREALHIVTLPMRRNRLFRLIADLSLIQLVPDLLPGLQGLTSDERAGSARVLGRLGAKSVKEQIRSLLQDPVQDVRKAAEIALRNLDDTQQQRAPTTKATDGTRTWVVDQSDTADASADDQSWKARLRSIMDS